ncbi:MAG: YfiR family protein [Cycloclasticus sp.]|nr:YfiR family protein [Cycloclasticus sp.]MBQ0789181.1 YfiR family protein [Cycloclasticus sp.]
MRLILTLFLLVPWLAFAEPNKGIRLKVALSYNLAKFTHWPDSLVNEAFTFCYFDSSYTDVFSQLKGKAIAKKKIKTRKLDYSEEVSTCQVLYLSKTDQPALVSTLLAAQNLPTLTLSDSPGFLSLGGMIEFVVVKNKMRFKVNNTRIKQVDLNLSSKVLKLALEVRN